MQKTPGKTPAAREKYWTKIIQEARNHPAGITDYCRAMNVSKNNYYFWFKRLRPDHAEWHDLTNHPEIIPVHRQKKKPTGESAPPATEVEIGIRKRKWSASEKERILKETDTLSGPDLASALRREGLYVHTLNKWRTQRDLLRIANSKTKNGSPNPLTAENKRLKEENARLQKKLHQANEIIQIQKKFRRC